MPRKPRRRPSAPQPAAQPAAQPDAPDGRRSETIAQELACEPLLAEIIAISDDPDLDASDKRVRIDARKWAIAQLAEKRADEARASSAPEGVRVHFIPPGKP